MKKGGRLKMTPSYGNTIFLKIEKNSITLIFEKKSRYFMLSAFLITWHFSGQSTNFRSFYKSSNNFNKFRIEHFK